MGLVFSFSSLYSKQSRLQASTSVTEARLREPETCPFAAGKKELQPETSRSAAGKKKKVTATFMAHGSGPWEWRRRPWPWCFLCQRHQILATACLPVSREVLLSGIQQQKKRGRQQAPPVHHTCEQAAAEPAASRLPDMRMCAVQNMCRPGGAPCLPAHCAGPADTTRRQLRLTGSG